MNYELLRPFDLEMAKDGNPMVSDYEKNELVYVAGPHVDTEEIVVEYVAGYLIYYAKDLRMSPLCWLHEKPVYKGDKLWSLSYKQWVVVTGTHMDSDGDLFLDFDNDGDYWISGPSELFDPIETRLFWDKPKPKVEKGGWLNIYGMGDCALHPTLDAAEKAKGRGCVATIEVEWEQDE